MSEATCEARTNSGADCLRPAVWVIFHAKAALEKRVCTQHQIQFTTGNPRTDADLEKDTGWTATDTIPSRKEGRRS